MNPDLTTGLSAEEAAHRLAQDGPNEISGEHGRRWRDIAAETLKDPMFALLLAAGVLYLVLGDLQEGVVMFAMVLLVLALTLYQEGRTENALAALRKLSAPRALVLRDGEQQRIAGSEVVRGDINADGFVNAADLGALLAAWGSAGGAADLNGDGTVGAQDLTVLLGAWN